LLRSGTLLAGSSGSFLCSSSLLFCRCNFLLYRIDMTACSSRGRLLHHLEPQLSPSN
jgi:hypothetical protein